MEYRQTTYCLAIHEPIDKFAIQTSIDEAKMYLEKHPDRKATLISGTYQNKDMKQIGYNQVQAFRRGELRMVDKKGNNNHIQVLDGCYFGIKNGLFIIHDTDVHDELQHKLLHTPEKMVDVTIHRKALFLTKTETDYLQEQATIAKEKITKGEKHFMPVKFILRLHIDNDFKVGIPEFTKYAQMFGERIGFDLFMAQYALHYKRHLYGQQCETIAKEDGENVYDYIDPLFLEIDTANFLYYDIINKNIIGADQEFLEKCAANIQKIFEEEVKNGG